MLLFLIVDDWEDDDRAPLKMLSRERKHKRRDYAASVNAPDKLRDRVFADNYFMGSRCMGPDITGDTHDTSVENFPYNTKSEDKSDSDTDPGNPFWDIRHCVYESSDSWEMQSGDSFIPDPISDSDSYTDDEYLAI